MATTSIRVAASTDDCAVANTGVAFAYFSATSSTGQRIGGYNSATFFALGGGMRFLSVPIPKGAKILPSYLQFTANANISLTTVNAVIRGEKSATPDTFSDLANYQGRRGVVVGGANDNNITTANVAWNNIAAQTNGNPVTSPDIASVIQEIVNLAGWTSGNNIVLFCDDHADTSSHDAENTYRQGASWNGDAANAPLLIVSWSVGGGITNKLIAGGLLA